jgi:hypothetical protein
VITGPGEALTEAGNAASILKTSHAATEVDIALNRVFFIFLLPSLVLT